MKPSRNEEVYFARKEFEIRRTFEMEKQKKLQDAELKKTKEFCHMKCPKCGMALIEIDYKGVEIDKCSDCQGVWLDAGELERVSKLSKTLFDEVFNVCRK